jgi:hypothetical protein
VAARIAASRKVYLSCVYTFDRVGSPSDRRQRKVSGLSPYLRSRSDRRRSGRYYDDRNPFAIRPALARLKPLPREAEVFRLNISRDASFPRRPGRGISICCGPCRYRPLPSESRSGSDACGPILCPERRENAMAQVGCPDRRVDRLCIMCCSPSQPLTSRVMWPLPGMAMTAPAAHQAVRHDQRRRA